MSLIQFQPLKKQHIHSGRMSGFTMVELMVALIIVIVLAAIAIPQFTSAMQTQYTSSEINNLLNDIEYARSEALKEGQLVGLCVSTTGTSCTGSTWQSGWIVYSAGAAAGFVTGTSVVLRVQPAFTTKDTITTTPAATNSITFNRDGFSSGFTGITGVLFTLHNSTNNSAATRCLWIDVLGRSYVQKYGAALASNGQATACT